MGMNSVAYENETEKGATIAGAISIHGAIIWLLIHVEIESDLYHHF